MALMDDLRTKLAAIGDAIRGKTGGSDALTLDGMVDAINGISTGSSGGSGGGGSSGGALFEDGYTLNFYDLENVMIESHSAKCGMWMDAPISYEVHHWQNASGHVNQFPLKVDSENAGAVYDLYPVVVDGENAVMVIDPAGTDFASVFPLFSSYTNFNYTAVAFNYNANEWKVQPSTDNYKNTGTLFTPIVNCEGYNYLKIKYLHRYNSDGFRIFLAKDTTEGSTGFPANYYKLIHISDSNTQNNDINAAMTDLDNALWKWVVIDISDLTEFYLAFHSNKSYNYIAEAIMTV